MSSFDATRAGTPPQPPARRDLGSDAPSPAVGRRAATWTQAQTAVWLAIVLIGIVSRAVYVDRGLDHRMLAPWREADYTAITRNFYRDGLNIFYPQIDWRGDTPGYAEMEFPLVPWMTALLDRVFGYHEALLRVPSVLLGILGVLVFAGLSRRVLPPAGALFATAAFAANPLLVILGNAMQPEPLMLLLTLIAMALIWRWDDEPRSSTLLAAAGVTAAAILAKAPAAYLGLVLATVAIRKFGARAFRTGAVYGAALVALLPPLAWYAWAARFWVMYGNSLGVSNESHYIGLDMFTPPRFLYGLLKWETLGVFTPAGWLLASLALWSRGKARLAFVWYGAVWVFFLVTARTSGDNWSFYYHSIAVAPACLLMGAGVGALSAGQVVPSAWGPLCRWQRWIAALLAAATLVALAGVTVILIRRRDTQPDLEHMHRCALQFVPYVSPSELIVVHGGTMVDEYNHPVAHNESMVFAWMDRKGFNYGTQELSVETLDRLAARGGRYWVVQHDELKRNNLRALVGRRYRRVAACDDGYDLYDLHSRMPP